MLLGRGHDGPGVVSEAFASLPHDRFDQVEVVRRRGERDVSHRGGQDRQFGLRIGALAVPAQQGVDGMYVVKACRTACDADNGGVAQQAAEAAIDPAYGIGAGAVTAVGQQRGVRSVRATATGCEIPISGGSGTVAESHEARLVALRPAHEAGTLVQVAIAERKPDKFPATQAGGIGERNRLTVDRRLQRRASHGRQAVGRAQQVQELLFREDQRGPLRASIREPRGVGHEAGRVAPPPVQAQAAGRCAGTDGARRGQGARE